MNREDAVIHKKIENMIKQKRSIKEIKELKPDSKGRVNLRSYNQAIEALDALINPDLYRDAEGKLRNKTTGRECWDKYHDPSAQGDLGRSLPRAEWGRVLAKSSS